MLSLTTLLLNKLSVCSPLTIGPFGVLFFISGGPCELTHLHVCVLLSEAQFLLSDLGAKEEIYSGYFELTLGMCALQSGCHKLLTKGKGPEEFPDPAKFELMVIRTHGVVADL